MVQPPPGEPSAEAGARTSDEPAAWAEVEARWGEPAAHQAYLARFPDLDGLTTAGRRYREVLAARPQDPQALAMKAEVVKRATVVGLASLPRTAPPVTDGPWRRRAIRLAASAGASALAWLLWRLFAGAAP
jgi:hypothetical protein